MTGRNKERAVSDVSFSSIHLHSLGAMVVELQRPLLRSRQPVEPFPLWAAEAAWRLSCRSWPPDTATARDRLQALSR